MPCYTVPLKISVGREEKLEHAAICHYNLSYAARVIVGQNSQRSMMACIQQNATGCSRTSRTPLAYCILGSTSSSGILNNVVELVVKCREISSSPISFHSFLSTNHRWEDASQRCK